MCPDMPKLPNDESKDSNDGPGDLNDRMGAGWAPSQLAAGPGNVPQWPKNALLPVISGEPAPRLCLVGPCNHYHRMRLIMNVQTPIDGSVGSVAKETIETCYPAKGVEMDLTGVQVAECNRWDPPGSSLAEGQAHALKAIYESDYAAWEKRREEEDDSIANAAIADDPGPSFTDDSVPATTTTEGEAQ